MLGKGEHTIHKKWSEKATNEVYMQLNARNKRRRKHSFSPQRFLYAHEHQMKCCMQRRKTSPRGTGKKKGTASFCRNRGERYLVPRINMLLPYII